MPFTIKISQVRLIAGINKWGKEWRRRKKTSSTSSSIIFEKKINKFILDLEEGRENKKMKKKFSSPRSSLKTKQENPIEISLN